MKRRRRSQVCVFVVFWFFLVQVNKAPLRMTTFCYFSGVYTHIYICGRFYTQYTH